jgi:hypothetical protein
MTEAKYEIERFVKRLLAQSRPSGTSAVSAYSPSYETVIRSIVVCNQGGTTPSFSIYLDDDGTTYDETTALFWSVPLAANETVIIDAGWDMTNSAGNLAVQTSIANDVTFTIFGDEASEVR